MDYETILRDSFGISEVLLQESREVTAQCREMFDKIDAHRGYNQLKVLQAFRDAQIAPMHFAPTYGYGYSDAGREKLEELFAAVFRSEDAIVRPQIASGTHALAIALYGLLRGGDSVVSLTGEPYDTLADILGTGENKDGSLMQMGVHYTQIELKNGKPDIEEIVRICSALKPRVAMLQRSRGYSTRASITVEQMKEVFARVKAVSPDTVLMVDNCYGEFVQAQEPTEAGADVAVGSLIKNAGGGLAPTGGYIVGKHSYIEQIGYRLTSPGIGREVGSYAAGYLPFFQGLFMAPHVVAEAMKGAVFAAAMYERRGYRVSPKSREQRSCIIQSVFFNNERELIDFCQSVQQISPVESHVLPMPWAMPGYQDPVIMAAGTFVQGASIELSADAPVRPPYVAYMQGGLVFEQVQAAVLFHLNKLAEK